MGLSFFLLKMPERKIFCVVLLTFISSTVNGNGNVNITQSQFNSAVTKNGFAQPTTAQYTQFMANLPKGQITTKQEAAMALAQLIHQSAGLTTKSESPCKDTSCPTEYRTPGCDVKGQYYYGRGYIQLSWCNNYKACSQDLYNSTILVTNPDLVTQDEDKAWASAFWYWKVYVHDEAGVAQGEFGATTNAINGDFECNGGPNEAQAEARFKVYTAVRNAFGLSGEGDESGCYD